MTTPKSEQAEVRAPGRRPERSPGTPWRSLAALGALAVVLRFLGLHFGFPYLYHFDEPSYLHMAYRFTFENFHPMYGSLFGPMQLMVMAAHAALVWTRPAWEALPLSPELVATLQSPIASYNLLARWLSALVGAASVLPVYALGARLWDRRTGLLAAAFLAVCFLHVRSSHYGVPDATVAFFSVLAAYFAVRLLPERRWRDYLLAGLFAGLALSAKLLAWPILLLPALVHLAAPLDRPDLTAVGSVLARLRRLFALRLVVAYVVALVAAVATMPQILVETEAVLGFWRQAAMVGQSGGLGHFRLDDGGPAWTYLYTLLWGTGALMTAAIFGGFVLAVFRPGNWRAIPLWIVTALYLLFLFRPGNIYHSRYLVAVMPLLVLFAGRLVGWLIARTAQGQRRRVAAMVVATLLVGLQPLVASIRHDILLTRPDTRTLAKEWIEANVPAGRTIAVETNIFSPPLSRPARPLPFSERVYDVKSREIFGLSALRQDVTTVGAATADDYRRAGVDYLITNSFISGFRMIDPELDRRMQAFYDSLEPMRMASFAPTPDGSAVPRIFAQNYGPATHLWQIERPGPEIRVYRLRADP